jgi:hypothetical protein
MRKSLTCLALLFPLQVGAAITVVGSGSSSGAAGSNQLTTALHASTTEGDAVIFQHTLIGDNAGEAVTTPSGYTLLETVERTDTGESIRTSVFCKIAGASEGSITTDTTGTGTGDAQAGRAVTLRGTDSCSTIVAHTAESATAAETGLSHPALTVSTANTIVMAFGSKRACEACVWDTLTTSGLVWSEQHDNNGASGDDFSYVLDYVIQTTATNVASGAFTATSGDETQQTVAILLSLKPAAAAPSFSVAPSCTATTNGVSCTYTASAASTAYGVGVSLADGAPSCTQIKAGQNDNSTAALATGSDANTGTADTIVVTGMNPIIRMDYHFCLNNGNGDSAVDSSQSAKDRSPRSGKAFIFPTSIATTSPLDQDAYFNPDFTANQDGAEYDVETNETANCDVTTEADGDFILTPAVGGACDGKRTIDIDYQYGASATTGLFTAPTIGTFASSDLMCFNNSPPTAESATADPVLLYVNSEMTAIELNSYFNDSDGDVLTFTETGPGTIPAGTSLGGTGNKDWTGTPTTEDENGEALTFTATDECGDFDEVDLTVYVTDDSVITPDCVNDIVPNCVADLAAVRPWLVSEDQLSATYTSHASVPLNNIISQSPTSPGTMSSTQAMSVVVSLGPTSATVPNLVGLNVTTVPGLLAAASLAVGVITYAKDPANLYLIKAQLPAASTQVAVGSSVNYTVGVASTIVDEPSRPR